MSTARWTFICCGGKSAALLTRKHALLTRKHALLTRKRALLTRKRALLTRKRALLTRKHALLTSHLTRHCCTRSLSFCSMSAVSFRSLSASSLSWKLDSRSSRHSSVSTRTHCGLRGRCMYCTVTTAYSHDDIMPHPPLVVATLLQLPLPLLSVFSVEPQ